VKEADVEDWAYSDPSGNIVGEFSKDVIKTAVKEQGGK